MATNAREVGTFGLAVAAELRAATARVKVTHRELAKRSGLSLSTVNKTLNGLRVVDVHELWLIASALDTTPERILTEAEKTLRKEMLRSNVPKNDATSDQSMPSQRRI